VNKFFFGNIFSRCKYSFEGSANHSGVLNTTYSTFFSIIFQCNETGTYSFSAVFSIPPFEKIVLSWLKQSNGKQLGMDVKVDEYPFLGSTDVVINGQTQDDWSLASSNVTQAAFASGIQTNTFLVSIENIPNLSDQSAYLYLPIVTVSNISCIVNVTGKEGIVSPKNTLKFNFHYTNCTLSTISVIIPVQNYGSLKFYYSIIPKSVPPFVFPPWLIIIIIFGTFLVLIGIIGLVNYIIVRQNDSKTTWDSIIEENKSLVVNSN